MQLLVIALNLATGALLAALLNSFAIRAFRRSEGSHWSERARVLYPARLGAKTFVWILPVIVVVAGRTVWPVAPTHFIPEWLAALAGALLGSYFFDKAFIPWLTWRIWWQEVALNWGFLAARAAVYFAAISQIGADFEWPHLLIAGAVILFDLWIGVGGLLRLYRACGWVSDAPARVRSIVCEICERMKVAVPQTWACPSSMCNAVALVWMRALLFTDSLIARLSDAELRGVVAHELAHLEEGRATRILRTCALLAVWPWLFVRPLVGVLGVAGLYLLLFWVWLVRRAVADFSRRMESRADRAAIDSDDAEKADYATALAKIYEANLMPAVMPAGKHTHPHLYDRMLGAGVVPDFPRPEPASKISALTFLVLVSFGFLLGSQLRGSLRAVFEWLGQG